MKTRKTTRRALVMSILALLMCVSMLVGTTFAWFTDTATASISKIQAGTLRIDLLQRGGAAGGSTGDYSSIKGMTAAIFDAGTTANNSNKTLWEPGATHVAYLAVRNLGNLALKYNIIIDVTDNGLASALDYAIVPQAHLSDASGANNCTATVGSWEAAKSAPGATVGSLPAGDQRFTAAQGGCLDEIAANSAAKNETDYFALVIHMREDAGNVYQGTSALIDITVTASQKDAEYDSFENTYDENSTLPSVAERVKGNGESGEIRKITGNDSQVKEGSGAASDKVNIKIEKAVSTGDSSSSRTIADATVPAPAAIAVMDSMFTAANGFEEAPTAEEDQTVTQDDVLTLTLKVDTIEAKPASLKVDVKLNALASRTVTVTQTSTSTVISETNKELPQSVSELTQPVTVELQLDKGLEDVKVTHSHAGAAPVEMTQVNSLAEVDNGKFYYDKASGLLTLKTDKFSEFEITFVAPEVCRIGTTPYTSLEDAVDAYKEGDTIVLTKDVGSDLMYPTVKKDVTVSSNGFGLLAEVASGKTLTVNDGEFKSFEISGEGNVAISGGKFTAFSYTGDVKVEVSGGKFYLPTTTAYDAVNNVLAEDNLYLKEDGDSWYTVTSMGDNIVAKIGNTGYTTLSEPVAAVTAGQTVKLVKDVSTVIPNSGNSPHAPIEPNASGTRTIDLNGHTFELNEGTWDFDMGAIIYLTSWSGAYNGTITFKDSKGNGKLICTNDSLDAGCKTAAIGNDTHTFHNFIIESGTYQGTSHGVYFQAGNVTVNGGTFIGPIAFEYGSDDYSGTKYGDLVINGGTFVGRFVVADKPISTNPSVGGKLNSVVVNGGKFKTAEANSYLASGKILVQGEDGFFEVKNAAEAPASYTAKIVNANGTAVYFSEAEAAAANDAITYAANQAVVYIKANATVEKTLKNGICITVVADDASHEAVWVDGKAKANQGYEIKKTAGTIENSFKYESKLKPVVEVRNASGTLKGEYATMPANANLSAGDTIKVLDDFTYSTTLGTSGGIGSYITLDLNGHTVTYTSSKTTSLKDPAIKYNGSSGSKPFKVIDSVGGGKLISTNADGVYKANAGNSEYFELSANIESQAGYAVKIQACKNGSTINSGTYTGTTGAVYFRQYSGTGLTIKGGTFNSTNGDVLYAEAGTVNITGGTFNGKNLSVKSGTVNVSGGIYNITAINKTGGTISITGGKFSIDPSAYLADGYSANFADGYYVVTKTA